MNFNAAIHQARMNEIDRLCYHGYLSTACISGEMNISLTHAKKYLTYMFAEKYLEAGVAKYGGRSYKSTRTFQVKELAQIKQPKPEKPEFTRTAPDVKPFADLKALPREFFATSACDVSHISLGE